MRLVEPIRPRAAVDALSFRRHPWSISDKHVTLRLSVVGDQWMTIRPSRRPLPLTCGKQPSFFCAPRPHGRQLLSDRRLAWSNYFLQDGWVGPSFAHLAAFGLKVLS
jgi:hypothetical protein